jgi:hypothetical protein
VPDAVAIKPDRQPWRPTGHGHQHVDPGRPRSTASGGGRPTWRESPAAPAPCGRVRARRAPDRWPGPPSTASPEGTPAPAKPLPRLGRLQTGGTPLPQAVRRWGVPCEQSMAGSERRATTRPCVPAREPRGQRR